MNTFENIPASVDPNNTEDHIDLNEIANTLGLTAELPTPDKKAYSNLVTTCKDYVRAIELAGNFGTASIDEKRMRALESADKRRRIAHNDLCIKIAGTDWQNTAPEIRRKISNFAFLVADKEEWIDSTTY